MNPFDGVATSMRYRETMSASCPSPEVLLEHASFVRAVARAVLSREDLAEDAVQDTWLAALKRPPQRRYGLRGWLRVVARRFLRNSVGEFDTGIFMQVHFRGLGGFGQQASKLLHRGIAGYEDPFD